MYFKILLAIMMVLSVETNLVTSQMIEKSKIKFFPQSLVQIDTKKNLTINHWLYTDDKLSLVSQTRKFIWFVCSAPFPIVWNITGYIKELDSVYVNPTKLHYVTETSVEYRLKMFIYFNPVNAATSSNVKCQSAENPAIFDGVNLFMKGMSDFVDSKKNLTVMNTNTLPCIITNPLEPVQLKQFNTDSMTFENVNSMAYAYDPQQGFSFRSTITGKYICVTKNDEVTITALETTARKPGYQFLPEQRLVRAFTTDNLTLICISTEGKVTIEANGSFPINISFSKGVWLASMQISSFESPKFIEAFCKSNDMVIMSWEVELVVPPILELDNYAGSMACISKDYTDIVISVVTCTSPSHCEFMKGCFADTRNLCNVGTPKYFSSNESKRCYSSKLGKTYKCAELPFPSLNGIVECKVRGLSFQSTYFSTIELLKETDYTKLLTSELVQMDDPLPIIYTNVTSRFFCKAAAFIFADSLKFQFVFSNLTTMLLNGTVNPGREQPRKVNWANIIGEIQIAVPLEVTIIRCVAHMHNSTKVVYADKSLNVKDFLPATLQAPVQNINITPVRRTLNCSATGFPVPAYTWTKNNQTIDRISAKVSTGEYGESLLELTDLEQVNENDEYTCEAVNRIDVDSDGKACADHTRSTENHPSICGLHIAKTVFIITSITKKEDFAVSNVTLISFIVFSIILALTMGCAFLILIRRYLVAKELLRDLTDNEINDFFNGNPELASSSSPSDPKYVDVAPYNENFELSLNEIDFSASKVLGEGQFSRVLLAKLKHSGDTVAVKLAKASAEVELFKSLLTEVKIMMFVGKHPNVVALAGVCTQGIRKRAIHIVLEMCENGSLDVFLRKNRNAFVNLLPSRNIQATQITKDKTSCKISTTNLIEWSANAALGMEFLSEKGIVHADIAARNILIDSSLVAKISDFGLSRKLYESNNYIKKSKTPLPWRWMAIESLQSLTFSTESDIWSFGMMLWEMFTLGDIPFPNESWDQQFLTRIATGMRMGKPAYSSPHIFLMISACWDGDQSMRPTFQELRKFFSSLTQAGMLADNENFESTDKTCSLYHNYPLTSTVQFTEEIGKEGLVPANENNGAQILNIYLRKFSPSQNQAGEISLAKGVKLRTLPIAVEHPSFTKFCVKLLVSASREASYASAK